ncbi:MAG: hypothetical protein IIW03_05755 [Clostridia bacterium]|nr:hypothetical protein [Clostridia bacterium]
MNNQNFNGSNNLTTGRTPNTNGSGNRLNSSNPGSSPSSNANGFTVPSGIGYDAYQGSIQQIMRDNIGEYMDVEFLIGTGGLTTRSGVLSNVGVSYIVLYDRQNDRYIICDLYSIKFVTIYNPAGNR